MLGGALLFALIYRLPFRTRLVASCAIFCFISIITAFVFRGLASAVDEVCLLCGRQAKIGRAMGLVIVHTSDVDSPSAEAAQSYRALFKRELDGHEHYWSPLFKSTNDLGDDLGASDVEFWFWIMPRVPDLERARFVIRKLRESRPDLVVGAIKSFSVTATFQSAQPAATFDVWYDQWAKKHLDL